MIERFGGIRPMAAKLGIPVTTVQGWKKRGHIPENRRADILDAAARHTVALSEAELDAAMAPEPAGASETEMEVIPPARQDDAPGLQPAVLPSEPMADTPPQPDPWAADFKPEPVPDREPLPPPPSPIPAAPSRKGNGLAAVALAASLLALGVGLYGVARTGGIPGLSLGPTDADPRVAVLEAELAEVRQALAGRPTAPTLPPGLADLPARVQALEGRLASVGEQTPAVQAGSGSADLSAVRADLSALAARIAALENTPAGGAGVDPALAGSLDSLRGRIVALEAAAQRQQALEQAVGELSRQAQEIAGQVTNAAQGASEAEALVLAAGQLQSALAAGRPYSAELRAVEALAGRWPDLAPALEALRATAGVGLPTSVALYDRFKALAPEVVRADRLRQDAGWVDQTLGRLSTLVTVRRASGEVAGDTVDAILARAEAAVDKGDLGKAVAELDTLQGPAAEVAAPWLAEARARVAAEQAAAAVADLAVARLGGGAKP
ncbi:hypothetical protein HHL28_09030 [Aerophototrophica crusticola]|uniref:Inner membrane protein n=1 Tax=Aerophototrophica crusticola TaxID=1709002 RepID=A0A858R7I2_9PROT|nr:hypothetical protein HHL28_09030 [Rhodospirillaceae bacterium B3]